MRRRRLLGLALLMLWPAARAAGADDAPADSAQAAPADTALGGFLRSLADSTDVYFGPSSAPTDTMGLDSALAFRLAHPEARERQRIRPEPAPWLTFNRVDGPVYGGSVSIGRAGGLGALSGRAGYAAGPNQWLGGGAYTKRWSSTHGNSSLGPRRRGERVWTLDGSVGRFTTVMDPDRGASWQRVLRAFLDGSDRQDYYQRDGFKLRLEGAGIRWRAALGYRDQLESPRVTTATWNLLGKTPEVIENRPARLGRAREAELEIAGRIPKTLVQIESDYRVAGTALGSDFEYQRLLVAAGGDVGLGHVATMVPQLEYGRLAGDLLPQAAFYLGGPHSLRSISTNQLAGTRKAFSRLDLIFSPDLAKLVGVPHPAFVTVQGGLFAASGATWGRDPYGGPLVEGDAWPAKEAWLSEAGVSLLYRPGVPELRGFMRIDYARGVGPNHAHKISVSYTVPLDLLRPIE